MPLPCQYEAVYLFRERSVWGDGLGPHTEYQKLKDWDGEGGLQRKEAVPA